MNFITMALLSIFSSISFAYEISPSKIELSHQQGKTTGIFVIKNTSESPIKVEAKLSSSNFDEFGVERSASVADGELIIFPKRIDIGPKAMGTFRVVYAKQAKVSFEKFYRASFKDVLQKPNSLKSSPNQPEINFTLSYSSLIRLVPDSGKSGGVVIDAIREIDGEKYISIKNSGDYSVGLNSGEFKIKLTNKTIRESTSSFKELKSPILARELRLVKVPSLKSHNIKVSDIEYVSEK